MSNYSRILPILSWGRIYNRKKFAADSLAAVIVTIMLVPQSLAYALVAGLPPQMGLYASILPLAVYALFGSSRCLSVGPVAVLSLMTAAALSRIGLQGSEQYLAAAAVLAFLVGVLLVIFGLLRLGFLANLLSHPVVAGFITASGIVIALGQVQHISGLAASGQNVVELLGSFSASMQDPLQSPNLITFVLGLGTIAYLVWARSSLANTLRRFGIADKPASTLTRLSPILAVLVTTGLAYGFELAQYGLSLVGQVPSGLPALALPDFSADLWLTLSGSAALIAMIGFVESVSVARGLAARQRERVEPDQELIGLGAANISAAFSAGFPVAGGFSRSVVNFDAGAASPAAGLFTAVLMAISTYLFVPFLAFLPKATLAAIIIVAVWSLLDFAIFRKTWVYAKTDFLALCITLISTLVFGVEAGIAGGITVSILSFLYKTSKPHVAIVGLVPGTEHFRNIHRHQVQIQPNILSLRIDESLYFANTKYLEDLIYRLIAEKQALEHIVLMCSAVNEIDMSALESLLSINDHLQESGIKLHLSEVKGPVMDKLEKSQLLEKLSGNIYLNQYQAIQDLR